MRILLVDDAALLRALFIRIATSLGHSVVAEAALPAAALEAARALAPDAIVLDGRLGGDGLARLLSDLRQAAPGSAVFVVAAVDEPAVVRFAGESGSAGVLRRPFSRTQIRSVLEGYETGYGAGLG